MKTPSASTWIQLQPPGLRDHRCGRRHAMGYPRASQAYPLYAALRQRSYAGATIFVRSSHNVESLAMPIENIIGHLDRDLPVSNVMTFRETIDKSTLDSEFDSLLMLGFASHRAHPRCRRALRRARLPRHAAHRSKSASALRSARGATQFCGGAARWHPPRGPRLACWTRRSMCRRLIESMLFDTKPLDPASSPPLPPQSSSSQPSPACFLPGVPRVSIRCRPSERNRRESLHPAPDYVPP